VLRHLPLPRESFFQAYWCDKQNLVTKAPSANLPAMLVAKLLPFVKHLCTRKWSDEDVIEDVQFLQDVLNENFQSLTYVPIWIP
jgi:hypothetical protein